MTDLSVSIPPKAGECWIYLGCSAFNFELLDGSFCHHFKDFGLFLPPCKAFSGGGKKNLLPRFSLYSDYNRPTNETDLYPNKSLPAGGRSVILIFISNKSLNWDTGIKV